LGPHGIRNLKLLCFRLTAVGSTHPFCRASHILGATEYIVFAIRMLTEDGRAFPIRNIIAWHLSTASADHAILSLSLWGWSRHVVWFEVLSGLFKLAELLKIRINDCLVIVLSFCRHHHIFDILMFPEICWGKMFFIRKRLGL
jgi:hypothetical protein